MGLGLAISRRILELHGSRIEARSEPQRGATFSFELPVYREDRPRRASEAA
jgi:signal transduction histidine kinase